MGECGINYRSMFWICQDAYLTFNRDIQVDSCIHESEAQGRRSGLKK